MYIEKGEVRIICTNNTIRIIKDEYLTDALTGLNVNISDVLAQIGRSKN
jgi:hypothetical protein